MFFTKLPSLTHVLNRYPEKQKIPVMQRGFSSGLQTDVIDISNPPAKSNPLDKYSSEKRYWGTLYQISQVWRRSGIKNKSHCAWKMHLYAEKDTDYQKILNCVGPYLDANKILWKTVVNTDVLKELKGGQQEGKAFTIYPRSNRNFEQIAMDIDYILRKNNLCTKKASIIGDNKLGNTGRLFYRYELKTGKAKNVIFDLDKESDWDMFRSLYESNRGTGNYLAGDMSVKDDPWYNFDPAKDKRMYIDSINGHKIEDIETCIKDDDKYILKKDTPYPLANIQSLVLSDKSTVNLSDSYMQKLLQKMRNDQCILIGRGPDCQVKVSEDDCYVSRNHVKIQKCADEFFIIDISTNGTEVIRKVPQEMLQ